MYLTAVFFILLRCIRSPYKPSSKIALTETENTTPNVILASLSRPEAWESGAVDGVENNVLVGDTTEGKRESAGKAAVPDTKLGMFCIWIMSVG